MDEFYLLLFLVAVLILLKILIKKESNEKFHFYDPKNNSAFNVAPKFWSYYKL